MTYLADPELVSAGAPKSGRLPNAAQSGIAPDRLVLAGSPPPLISRIRFQLPGALLVAVVAPLLFQGDALKTSALPNVINTSAGVWLAIILGYYALRRINNFPTIQEVGSVVPVYTVSFLTVIVIFFFARLEYSRAQFLAGYGLSVGWFILVLALARRGRRRQFALVPLGDALSIRDLAGASWQVIRPDEALPKPCSGIVADLGADMPPDWQQFLTSCVLAGVPVYHFKHVREALTGRLEIEHLSENMLGSHNPHDGYLKVKRIIDTLVALAALIILGPFLLVVGALIRFDSRGPALFTQARMRQGGSTFTIYKFRTMTIDAARPGSRQDAITREHDPRITRLGAFLRKSRIDELPQILNIIKGEMSWIGPRPEAIPLAQWYQQQLPFYQYRHIVPPGITGWAQVNQGHVTDPKHVLGKLHYDFYYIKNFSVWLDILIVLKTLRTMMTGFGAR